MGCYPVLPYTAHPRSRGEHEAATVGYGAVIGSSPLARGTLNATGSDAGLVRLIPARAGNTSASAR